MNTDPGQTHPLDPSLPENASLRRGLRVQIRETSTADRLAATGDPDDALGGSPSVLDFIASNERLDRYDEVILAGGWRLDTYRRNPVFQNAHQYGDILFTIGRALVTEVRDDALFQRVEFAVEANPFARIAFGLYRGGFLNAVSVGFIPLRWEEGGPNVPWRRRYLEQELLEVSAVGIPANPDALQIGIKSGAVRTSDLREAADLLRQLMAGTDRPPSQASNDFSPASVLPVQPRSAAPWLQLARALHAVMRRG